MIVGILRLRLHMRGNRSLKDKRQIVLRIKDKVAHHFNVAVAEVGDNDDWKVATLGFSTVSNDAALVQSVLQKVGATVESLHVAEVLSHDLIVRTFSEEEFLLPDR